MRTLVGRMSTFLYFDIDGTLLHSRGAGSHALTLAFREIFHEPNFSGIRINGCTDRGIAEQIFATHGIEDSPENWDRFREGYLKYLPSTLAEKKGEVLPGVVELLDRLRVRRRVQLGILTGNSADGAREKLRHFGLAEYFQFGAYGDDHPDRDDVARQAFGELRQRHGEVAGDDVWIIGDTPNDIRCGQAIGANVLAVATGAYDAAELARYQPTLLLDDFRDPTPWLNMLPE